MLEPSKRLLLALALAFALLARGSLAAAVCRVSPGPEGEVGAWLVAGPFATPQGRPRRTVDAQLAQPLAGFDASALRPEANGAVLGRRWTAVSSPEARANLDAGAPPRGARTVLAALTIRAAEAGRAWLFLGPDDGAVVYLDGRELHRRGARRDARDDDDLVPLELTAGEHRLLLRLYVDEGPANLYARLVGSDFAPSTRFSLELPGVAEEPCRELGRAALRGELRRAATASGTRLLWTVRASGGLPHPSQDARWTAQLRLPGLPTPTEAALALEGPSVQPVSLEGTVDASASSSALTLLFGPRSETLASAGTTLEAPLRATLVRAEGALASLDEAHLPAWLPAPSYASLRTVFERLRELAATGDEDRAHLLEEARSIDSLLASLAAQRDPYAGLHGALRRGYRSSVDGSLQGYSLYVPPSYRGDRPFPVVVALHGLGGTAHRMLPVLFGLYDEHESRTHADRHLPPLPDTGALLVAPFGFGDTGYRAMGERDVLDVLEQVRAAYRVDDDRVYMTGLSMGGIGAAGVPLHNPDRFAATAALCGYHSYFVRNDTAGDRRPWEVFLMEARSNALWAENGLHLPLYVVHGTRDQPVANSRVLVDRYRALGYSVEAEWPDLPHNVWSTTYAGGRIVPYFLRMRRDPNPAHVRFRTAGLRWRQSYWVRVDALERHDAWGDVDAELREGVVRVRTSGVRGITLTPPAALLPRGASSVRFVLDGDTVEAPAGAVSLLRSAGHWRRADSAAQEPALGPLRDVFDGPVAVVFGTQDPATRVLEERVARAWARGKTGVRARFPVLADTAVDAAFARAHTLVLVGTPSSNAVLARLHARLPLRVEGDALVGGTHRWRGAGVGAAFVTANPEAPERPLVVLTGTDAVGVWRSRHLPDLVPDFLVYDGGVAPARGRVLLGPNARVLGGGFFGPDGSVPARTEDTRAASQTTGETGARAAED